MMMMYTLGYQLKWALLGQQKLVVRWTSEVHMRVWGVNKRVCKHSCSAPPSYGNIYQRTVISTSHGYHTFIRTSTQSTGTVAFVISVNALLGAMPFHTCSTTRTAQGFSMHPFTHNAVESVEPQLFLNIHQVWQRTLRTTTLSVCWIHPLRYSEIRQRLFCILSLCVWTSTGD